MNRFDSDNVEGTLKHDLDALGRASLDHLPTLNNHAPAPERRRATLLETLSMSAVQTLKTRPWAATAALTAALVLVLLMVPISYTRTLGHEVTLRLPNGTTETAAFQIGTELGRTLQADNVNVSGTTVTARVSGRPVGAIQREAASFARLLSERNIEAGASVSPIQEKTSTNLLAYAAGRVLEIRIEDDGRSDSEIEADIRNQLEAAGLENPTVTLTTEGDSRQITIHAEGSDKATVPDEINVLVNGSSANQHKVQIQADRKMSDAELKAEIERQLQASGVDAEVTVTNGQVSVRKRQ